MITHQTHWTTSDAQKLLATSCSRLPTVARYTLDVLTGNVPAGRLVFLAVERFLDDLQSGKDRGLRFDQGSAAAVILFFRNLAFAKKPLLPFEQFIVANLFGWLKADGSRRFQTAYLEEGKGNRKTPFAGGLGLCGLTVDEEAAPEIYIVAPTKDQSAITFRDAYGIVTGSPSLRKIVKAFGCSNKFTNANLSHKGGFMRPIAADSASLDGPRPSMVIVDEAHEVREYDVINKLVAGFKARRNPMLVEITNSGFDRQSICWEHHEYSRKILERIVQNDSWFAYICQLDTCPKCREQGKDFPSCDDCDSWLDEDVWIKANPALGTILPKSYLQKQVKEALEIAGSRSLVQRLNFCIWTQSEERFISPEAWRACGFEPGAEFDGDPVAWRNDKIAKLRGRYCFGGLDLGIVDDFTCLALYFPEQSGVPVPVLLMWSWAPKDVDHHQLLRERYGYNEWVRGGFLKQTSLKVTDYEAVREDIMGLHRQFVIRELAYDRAYATEMVQKLLGAGVKMVEHGQGSVSMTYPIKEFHRSIVGRTLAHGMNPLLTFMVDNLAVESDGKGNLSCHKPDNPKSPRKIDGAVASIMARGRGAANPMAQRPHVYRL